VVWQAVKFEVVTWLIISYTEKNLNNKKSSSIGEAIERRLEHIFNNTWMTIVA